MLLPAPRTSRDLLEAFRTYDPNAGIGKFLDQMDLTGVTPRQAMYCVFGRLPGRNGARTPADYNPRGHLRVLLLGEEFQKRLMQRVLDTYPEKTRMLLVHVPKCAGSDLTVNLMNRYPAFNFRLADREWFPPEKMLAALRKLVDDLAYSERIFVHGHVPLRQYLSNGLVRFGDHCFTIVRDPLDMVISKINYMLTRFSRDPELKAVDTRAWLRLISHDKVVAAIKSGDYRETALEMLFTPGLVERNPICHHLGEGTAASAFDLCARADIEIAHVDRYEEWLRLRWGVAKSSRTNASQPLVSMDMLGEDGLRQANLLTGEDRVFADAVRRHMKESDSCFVMGTQLDL